MAVVEEVPVRTIVTGMSVVLLTRDVKILVTGTVVNDVIVLVAVSKVELVAYVVSVMTV